MNKYALGGGGLVLIGLAVAAVPSLAAALGVRTSFVYAVGVIALVQGLRAVLARRRTAVTQTDPPTPERPRECPIPGDQFDEGIESGRVNYGQVGRRLHERLERAAVDALVHGEGLTEDEARAALENGTWTDDPWAAAQFANGVPDWAPWHVRLRAVARRNRTRRMTRAAAEIARIAGVTDDA
ncbi:DUF7269 family protein [Natrinema salifodinae]|uniref:Uncharacterized protein n=1 Tax=Natrinema salifodinae TaxID=1202768 RepID=A0A1I0MI75_9EURY|nr:hypothetical protein [Natrinema salifodinae]SEV87516.1 hypothetical protein SAMN05216285_0948 [Natrinema salifodinae]